MTISQPSAISQTVHNPSHRRLVDTLIVDAGPIISSASTPSYYLTTAERIFTTPAVISEIRDKTTRLRFETIWKPFLTVKAPRVESLKFVVEFAKKTGDYKALSSTDLGLIALAYELELEVAGGDWRLRNFPGQKELNGPLPAEGWSWEGRKFGADDVEEGGREKDGEPVERNQEADDLAQKIENVELQGRPEDEEQDFGDSDDDSEGWITPSNLHHHIHPSSSLVNSPKAEIEKLTVALATTDFAMQNTLLQLNIHLLSPSTLMRIKHIRSTALRCHACFFIIKHPTATTSHFCPRCGAGDTLQRVTCSTDSNGEFRIHLKTNYQYNTRGNVFSIPKPVHGSCSMKGVQNAPVLREDQKEYQRAMQRETWRKERNLLDPDYLPGILTGERRQGSTVRVGVGRKNPNQARKGGGRKKR